MFRDAGITTLDVADHYGDAELLIQKFIKRLGKAQTRPEVLTKVCYFGAQDMRDLDFTDLRRRVKKRCANLGIQKGLDMVQLYWGVSAAVNGWDAVLGARVAELCGWDLLATA